MLGCCQTKRGEKEELEYYSDEEEQGEPEKMDLGEMGNSMMAEEKTSEVREIVTPSQAAALKEELSQIVLLDCNHQLCGCGGCYKRSFYGITSYQCVEVTPSLACGKKMYVSTFLVVTFALCRT